MLKGIKIEKDTKGRAKKVTFDLKHHGGLLEDLIDGMEAEAAKDGPSERLADVKKRLDKKHGIKPKK